MRLFRSEYLFAAVTLLSGHCLAQVQSEVIGPQHACRNELGQFEVSYEVRNRFSNSTNNSMTVKIGIAGNLNFMLFSNGETTDPASAVYQYNPDSVSPPKARSKHLRPGEHIDWDTVATITIARKGDSNRSPRAGQYFLLAFPDLTIGGQPRTREDLKHLISTSRLIPIVIDEPPSNVPVCK